MGKLIDAYNEALEIEDENPVSALTTFETQMAAIKPTSSKEFIEGEIISTLFMLGFFFGLIADIYYATKETLFWAILLVLAGPFIQGILAAVLFNGFARIIINVNKPTKSEKYWVSLLATIGAGRCAIQTDQTEKVEQIAENLRGFEYNITRYLADGFVALANNDFSKSHQAFNLAAHDDPPGIFSEYITDAIYRCSLLHPVAPQTYKKVRRQPHQRSPAPQRIQHIHGDAIYGKQDIRVQDSVVHRSNVGSTPRSQGRTEAIIEESWD